MCVEGNGPDLSPRDDLRIRDAAPVILLASDGVQLAEMNPDAVQPGRDSPRRPSASYQ